MPIWACPSGVETLGVARAAALRRIADSRARRVAAGLRDPTDDGQGCGAEKSAISRIARARRLPYTHPQEAPRTSTRRYRTMVTVTPAARARALALTLALAIALIAL